eukprot:9494484-Pyramimonas_sp.AAC.1
MPVHVKVSWKVFPTKRAVGCLLPEVPRDWIWEVSDWGELSVEQLWQNWISNVESELCDQFDIHGPLRGEHTGRASGFRRKQVPLESLLSKKWQTHSSRSSRAWRSLVAYLMQAARVFDIENTEQRLDEWSRLADRFHGLREEDLQPRLKKLAPSLEALVQNLWEYGTEEVPRLLTEAQEIHQQVLKEDSRRQWKAWKDWAEQAVKGGGKEAHRFSKGPKETLGPMGAHGWTLQGDEAIQELMKEWGDIWGDLSEGISAGQARWLQAA